MYIQSYQIHNVLNVYRRQLSQGKSNSTQAPGKTGPPSDAVTLSAEGKNQSIMEKVTANVLKRVTNVKPGSAEGEKAAGEVKKNQERSHRHPMENSFTFNTILENNQKETRTISVDGSKGFNEPAG